MTVSTAPLRSFLPPITVNRRRFQHGCAQRAKMVSSESGRRIVSSQRRGLAFVAFRAARHSGRKSPTSASGKAFEPNRSVIRHIKEVSKGSARGGGRSGHPDRQTAPDDSSLSCGGACLYFVISLLPAARCLRSCSLCRAFSPKQKRSIAATWQGRSFESPPTGSVRHGWTSIPVHKPPLFLVWSRTL